MLPITLAVSGSTSQMRGPPALGLGSSTYSHPDSGLAQFSTSMFECIEALVWAASFWVGALVWPAGAPAWAGRGASVRDTERRQNMAIVNSRSVAVDLNFMRTST